MSRSVGHLRRGGGRDGLDPKEPAEAGAVQEAHGSTQCEDLTRVDEAKGSTVPPPTGRRERRDPLPILSIIPPLRGTKREREREREIWAGSRISPHPIRTEEEDKQTPQIHGEGERFGVAYHVAAAGE